MGFQFAHRMKVSVEAVPVAIQCNVCGRTRTVAEHGKYDFHHDMHEAELGGGWGDEYPADLHTLTFVTCGDCLKALTATFKVPPDYMSGTHQGPPKLRAVHSETGAQWVVDGLWAYPEGTEFVEPSEDEDDGEDVEVPDLPSPGVYEHFKGKHYEVLKCVLTNPEAPEVLVVYRALYGDSTVFVRPVKMWNEAVPVQGRDGLPLRRFR